MILLHVLCILFLVCRSFSYEGENLPGAVLTAYSGNIGCNSITYISKEFYAYENCVCFFKAQHQVNEFPCRKAVKDGEVVTFHEYFDRKSCEKSSNPENSFSGNFGQCEFVNKSMMTRSFSDVNSFYLFNVDIRPTDMDILVIEYSGDNCTSSEEEPVTGGSYFRDLWKISTNPISTYDCPVDICDPEPPRSYRKICGSNLESDDDEEFLKRVDVQYAIFFGSTFTFLVLFALCICFVGVLLLVLGIIKTKTEKESMTIPILRSKRNGDHSSDLELDDDDDDTTTDDSESEETITITDTTDTSEGEEEGEEEIPHYINIV